MSPEEYLSLIAERLRADGAEVTTEYFRGTPAVVGYRSEFRLRWMATKLNLFTVALAVPLVTPEKLKHFSEEVLDYATSQKGRFRGLQNAVAAIPVQIGSQVNPEAILSAETKLIRRFSAFAWPAVVDLSTGRVHSHQGRVAVGGIYASWMRQQTAVALKDVELKDVELKDAELKDTERPSKSSPPSAGDR